MSIYYVAKNADEMDSIVRGAMIGNMRPYLTEQKKREAYFNSFAYPVGLRLISCPDPHFCDSFEIVDAHEAGNEILNDLNEEIKCLTDERNELIKWLEGIV